MTITDINNGQVLRRIDFNDRKNYEGQFWHWYNFLIENTTNQEHTVCGLQYKLQRAH